MIRSRGRRPEFSVLNTERGVLVLGQDREWCAIHRDSIPVDRSLVLVALCEEFLCLA